MELIPSEAGIGGIIALGLGIGLSYLTRVLQGSPSIDSPTVEPTSPTTVPTHQRGSAMPFVIGEALVTPTIIYTGNNAEDPITTTTSSGGKFGGGSSTTSTTEIIYKSRGFHVLNFGMKGQWLGEILDGARVVWEGNLTPSNTSDGTLVSTDADGDFRVYWGGVNGHFDSTVADRLGIDGATLPYCFYVHWDRKERSNQANWPNYRYRIRCYQDSWLLPGGNGLVAAGSNTSVNAAHAVYELMAQEAPIGAEMPTAMIDTDEFELLADRDIRCDYHGRAGDSVADIIQAILTDNAYVMSKNRQQQLTLRRLGLNSAAATISGAATFGALPERRRPLLQQNSKPMLFQFRDRSINFQPNSFPIPHDGVNRNAGTAEPEVIQLRTIVDANRAARIAARQAPRHQARLGSLDVNLGYGAVQLRVGDVVDIENLGKYRIQTKRRETIGSTFFKTVQDVGFIGEANDPDDQVTDDPTETFTNDNDVLVVAVQNPGENELLVFRVRANLGIVTSSVFVSTNGGSLFVNAGQQNAPAAGGQLEGAWNRQTLWAATTTHAAADVVRSSGTDKLVFGATAVEAVWVASTDYALSDRRQPTTPNGFTYVVTADAGSSGATEPTWPTTNGATVVDGGITWTAEQWQTGATEPTWPTSVGSTVLDNNITWVAQLDAGPVWAPLNDDQTWLDLTGDDSLVVGGEQVALVGTAGVYEALYFKNVISVDESNWAASAATVLGDYVKPLTGSTGFRYEATAVSGNTGATEPVWPTTLDATVVDGGVTWTARRFAKQLDGVTRGEQGSAIVDHADGEDVVLIRSGLLEPITTTGLKAGVTAQVKTNPATTELPADLSSATAVSVTLV